MTTQRFPSINPTTLVQPSEVFYGRMNPGEEEAVRDIVGSLREFMLSQPESRHIVAGVGGILRYEDDPRLAKDIDLAVVGEAFKYTSAPARKREHNFGDVEKFTRTINAYFENYILSMASERGLQTKNLSLRSGSGEMARFRRGSGPFSYLDQAIEFEKGEELVARVESEFEEFGWYNSKGFQVCFEGIRPIDVQFVFNENPEEWEQEQKFLREIPTKQGREIVERFYYALL